MAMYEKEKLFRLKRKESAENPYPSSLIMSTDYGTGETYSMKPTTPFKPYADPYINMNYDPYEMEDREEITEYLLELFINKMLTNQAVSLAEGRDYHEDFENTFYNEDKVPEMYKVRSNNGYYFEDKVLPKKKQQNTKRQSKKKKSRSDSTQSLHDDLPAGSDHFYRADGTQMITLSVNMMRQYMHTEVEVRVRHINEYYRRQWNVVHRERMQALADLIKCQEAVAIKTAELTDLKAEIKTLNEKCTSQDEQLKVAKEAKKRRRQAKKQRKTENSLQDCNEVTDEQEDLKQTDPDCGLERTEKPNKANDGKGDWPNLKEVADDNEKWVQFERKPYYVVENIAIKEEIA